ncbi:MAG: ERAP1-like C-terminal domain-containing protein, partial [Pseudomonadota bacterium]
MVYPNHDDWGYAEVTLGDATVASLETRLGQIDDPLLRSMFWHTLIAMAEKAELHPSRYFDLVLTHLPGERNDRVVGQVVGDAAALLGLLHGITPEGYEARTEYGPRIEALLRDIFRDGEMAADVRILLFDAYIGLALSDKATAHLAALLSGDTAEEGIVVDQDRRWAIIQQLNAAGYDGAGELLVAETLADPSDAGQRAAIAAEAGRPDIAAKRKWLARLHDDDDPLPLSRARAAIYALFPSHQSVIQAGEAALNDKVIELGQALVAPDQFVLPFELASVLLLAA